MPSEPRLQRLQRWVQCPGAINVTPPANVVVEVALELEHVAQVFGTGKPETAVQLLGFTGRDGWVAGVVVPREQLPPPLGVYYRSGLSRMSLSVPNP